MALHQDNAHRPMDLRAGAAGATGAPARSPADWPLLAAASAIAAGGARRRQGALRQARRLSAIPVLLF